MSDTVGYIKKWLNNSSKFQASNDDLDNGLDLGLEYGLNGYLKDQLFF